MTQEEIKINIENQIEDFRKTLKPDEIAESEQDFNPKKTKLIDGAADFEKSTIKDLGTLEVIIGNAAFFRYIKNLGNLTIIGGNSDFQNTKVENLGNLKIIGRSANFQNSQIKNLGNLISIGGTANFEDSKVENLGNLTTIGRDAFFPNSEIENLGNLTTIEGIAYFEGSQVQNLGNLSYIGGFYANGNKLTKEQVEQHIKNINAINLIRKGLYYISNGEVFIKRNDVGVKKVDYTQFFIKDLKFNNNGTIELK
jgi:hypothetical protein